MDVKALCEWLEANSSGVYRPAREAAEVIRNLESRLTAAENQYAIRTELNNRQADILLALTADRDQLRAQFDAAKGQKPEEWIGYSSAGEKFLVSGLPDQNDIERFKCKPLYAAPIPQQTTPAESVQTNETVKFKIINAGMYDDTCQCVVCGFCYENRADNSFEENTDNSKHVCKSPKVEQVSGGDVQARIAFYADNPKQAILLSWNELGIGDHDLYLQPSLNKADVSEGWRLVPVVADEEMRMAANHIDHNASERELLSSDHFMNIYAAMVAAAPLPPLKD